MNKSLHKLRGFTHTLIVPLRGARRIPTAHLVSGFTLIELLVVISIIGILSAVVLASLSSVRSRGNDAAIQTNLSTIMLQAEVYYGGVGGNTYGTPQLNNSCTATVNTMWDEATIEKAIAATEKANGAGFVRCNSSATAYAVSSKLLAGIGPNMFWCVDSTGSAVSHLNELVSGVTLCP